MTVPAVPIRSSERRERSPHPFPPFPLPTGGNVGNAFRQMQRLPENFSAPDAFQQSTQVHHE